MMEKEEVGITMMTTIWIEMSKKSAMVGKIPIYNGREWAGERMGGFDLSSVVFFAFDVGPFASDGPGRRKKK